MNGEKIANALKAIWLVATLTVGMFLLSSVLSAFSRADDWGILVPRSVDLGYTHFFPGGSAPLITQNGLPHRTLGAELELKLDTNLLHYMYWDSRIHSMTDKVSDDAPQEENPGSGQFRLVGLETRLGVNVTDHVQLGYYHHSQHLLDTTYSAGRFPVEDGLELRINVYRSSETPHGLF